MSIHYDLPFKDYLRLPGLSPSMVKQAAVSLKAFRQYELSGIEPTDSMRLGSAIDCAVLEPSLYAERFAVWRGKVRNGKVWDEFEAQHTAAGREIITAAQDVKARTIQSKLCADPVAKRFLDQIEHAQVSLTWAADKFRGRIDAIGGNFYIDLKSIHTLTRKDIEKAIINYGYDLQMYAYHEGLSDNGQSRDGYIIFAETDEPFDVAVVPVTGDMLLVGEAMWNHRVALIDAARGSGEYPGVAGGELLHIELPDYHTENNLTLIGADNA